ncbi:MAG: permease [Pseudomonadota bacterium]
MLLSWLTSWALNTLDLFRLMAPFLLLGFLLAGLLHVTVPKSWVSKHMGGRGVGAAVRAALVGIPLPLCSCGVIPFADSLKRQGASTTAITSFLIATPQTGVDSILATSAMLGPLVAVWRVLTALVSGVVGGSLAGLVDPAPPEHAAGAHGAAGLPKGLRAKLAALLDYGLGMLVEDVAFWLVVGLAAGGAIATFVPDELFASTLGHPVLQWGAVLAVAVPLYVCATGSIPIAAALVAKGLPLGAAVVFLIAGPATNVATLTVFARALGGRVVAVYLGTIVVLSLAFGVAFELLFPGLGLPEAMTHAHQHGPLAEVRWWEWATGAVLAVAIARALWVRGAARLAAHRRTATSSSPLPPSVQGATMDFIELVVTGMTCKHCEASVRKALAAVPGVDLVEVSLEAGRAVVEGEHLDIGALIQAVEAQGYEAEEAEGWDEAEACGTGCGGGCCGCG